MNSARLPFLAVLLWVASAACAREPDGLWRAGRARDEDRGTRILRLHAGRFGGFRGEVEETKRAGTEAVTDEGRYLETYTFQELGLDGDFASFGIAFEKQWAFVTFSLDGRGSRLDAAETARRIYAIGVSDVRHEGRSYEYMLIPEGRRFEADMRALFLDARLRVTPFHLASRDGRIRLSPWALGGLFGIVSTYTVDAGPSEGVTTYELDPYPYVIGGRGEGSLGGLAPHVGAGLELRVGLWDTARGPAILSLQAEAAGLDIRTRSDRFGVRARNVKNIDLSYRNAEVRAQVEIPVLEGADFLLGMAFQRVEMEADISADRTPPDRRTTEKYDKFVTLDANWFIVFVGLKF